jgi:predicted  nucleic acid-binding Zn-ribbon protein
MQNWFIAAFESAGLWTHEQAEHVSKEVRLTIHKENYSEAVQELSAILNKYKNDEISTIEKLQNRITQLEIDLEDLAATKNVAKPKKV